MCQPKDRRRHHVVASSKSSIEVWAANSRELAVTQSSITLHELASQKVAESHDGTQNQVRLPSLNGFFERNSDGTDRPSSSTDDNDNDDEESINSQAIIEDALAIAHHDETNDTDVDVDDDDDVSIVSQVKDSASKVDVTITTPPDAEIVCDGIIESNDDEKSLSSMISKARSVTSRTSVSCFESLSSSSSSSDDVVESSNERRRRKVVFVRQHNEIYQIPNRRDFTQEERKSAWYQRKELASMLASRFQEEACRTQEPCENNKLVSIPESLPEELMGSSSLFLLLASPLHTEEYLSGAFDQKSCRPTDAESVARIMAVMDAVMDEQETQWLDDGGEPNHDRLAQASLNHSRTCERDALQRAHLDALQAIPIYLEEEDALIDSVRSTSIHQKNSNNNKFLAPFSALALSPKARLSKMRLRERFLGKKAERRWTVTKMEGGRGSISSQEGSTPSTTNNNIMESSSLLVMPKRRESNNHGTESFSSSENKKSMGLTMPKRMASFEESEDEMDDIQSIVSSSSSSFSVNSESDDDDDDDYEEDLAPPRISIPTAPFATMTEHCCQDEANKMNRTSKLFFSNTTNSGIYQKLKRKLHNKRKKKKSTRLSSSSSLHPSGLLSDEFTQ